MNRLVQAISIVNSEWALAAFAIAAMLLLVKWLFPVSNKGTRLHQQRTYVLWIVVGFLFVLVLAPIAASTYRVSRKLKADAIYRIHVTVLDTEAHPVHGVTLHTTALNETTTGMDGAGEIATPRGSLPQTGIITVYADRDSAFEYGRADLHLNGDPNLSITITLMHDNTATVTGLVEDDAGHFLARAQVSIIGGESGMTGADGSFTLKANAAPGQMVSIHAEKTGFIPVNQYQPAGREPATVVLIRKGIRN